MKNVTCIKTTIGRAKVPLNRFSEHRPLLISVHEDVKRSLFSSICIKSVCMCMQNRPIPLSDKVIPFGDTGHVDDHLVILFQRVPNKHNSHTIYSCAEPQKGYFKCF